MTATLITLPVLMLIGIDWMLSRAVRRQSRLRAKRADNELRV